MYINTFGTPTFDTYIGVTNACGAPMLAVNRKLGYRPAGRRVDYLK